MWQAHRQEDHKGEASGLSIRVAREHLEAAEGNPDEWLTYSGSYNGWRHTPLAEITPANVAQLRVRWVKQFDSNDQFIEATPLVIGGVIFTVAPASNVLALDAKTGDVIWEYKRSIPAKLPICCGRVNRGLAAQGSTLFFGSLDGSMRTMGRSSGKLWWQVHPMVTRLQARLLS
jgi:alcohol dehydrogenase (cytochrome c)